ncbi:retrovirus-related pol polyprotein from transposon TNT 1-94, partial [Tanacetum coccineum]
LFHKTSVSRPQLRSTQLKDKVVQNNSQVKTKKTKVEDHHRISSFFNKTTSVTACNDSLKSRTSNFNVICVTCGNYVFNSNHDACVSKFINDVNTRNKKPKVVPISARKPKRHVKQSVATPHKKIVASESTIQKSKSYFRMLYENTNADLEETSSPTPISFMAKASPTAAWLWHHRLSYLNFHTINLLSKKDIVNSLPYCYLTRDDENLDKMKEKGDPYHRNEPSSSKLVPNVSPLADKIDTSLQELDLLFSPLFEEYFSTGNQNVSKSFALSDNLQQQDTQPTLNIQPTLEPTTPTINVNTGEYQAADAQFEPYEFINPLCTPVQEVAKRQLATEAMQEELHQFDRLKVCELVDKPYGKTAIKLKCRSLGSCSDLSCLRCIQILSYLSDGRETDFLNGLKEEIKASSQSLYDELSTFLMSKGFTKGLQIHQSPKGIFINQAKYALEILKKHGIDKCDSLGTPMATKLKLDADLSGLPVD